MDNNDDDADSDNDGDDFDFIKRLGGVNKRTSLPENLAFTSSPRQACASSSSSLSPS